LSTAAAADAMIAAAPMHLDEYSQGLRMPPAVSLSQESDATSAGRIADIAVDNRDIHRNIGGARHYLPTDIAEESIATGGGGTTTNGFSILEQAAESIAFMSAMRSSIASSFRPSAVEMENGERAVHKPYYDIYLSYNSVVDGTEFVELLYQQLVHVGLKVWLDFKCRTPDMQLLEGVIQGMTNSKIFVCILPRAEVTSRYLQKVKQGDVCPQQLLEFKLALDLLHFNVIDRIYPIKFGDYKIPLHETGQLIVLEEFMAGYSYIAEVVGLAKYANEQRIESLAVATICAEIFSHMGVTFMKPNEHPRFCEGVLLNYAAVVDVEFPLIAGVPSTDEGGDTDDGASGSKTKATDLLQELLDCNADIDRCKGDIAVWIEEFHALHGRAPVGRLTFAEQIVFINQYVFVCNRVICLQCWCSSTLSVHLLKNYLLELIIVFLNIWLECQR
jgi:hypothetical protein